MSEDIKNYLDYNPNTGVFTWKKKRGQRVKVGSVAGSKRNDGYIGIKFNQKVTLAHRLVFLFMGQSIPDYVDHINGVRDDNRWVNLRPCNHFQNNSNVKKRSDNTSGIKGVIWRKDVGKWQSYIQKNYKQTHLGYFDCIAHASCIRAIAEDKYHGEFAYKGVKN